MKILIVQDYLRSGGTERQTILLANAFAKAEHDVTLITFRPSGPLAANLAAEVVHHPLQRFDTHLDWFAPGLSTLTKKIIPDIVLCMGRMANCYGHAFVNAARHRWPNTAVIGTMRTGKKLPWLFRHSLRKSHHIAANSRAAKVTLLNDHSIQEDKITVIHNSLVFPANVPNSERKTLRAKYGADAQTTVMLDVAMFRREKNQRELIVIAAGLPARFKWQLWLAGVGPELDRCRRCARELGVADKVRFLGFTKDPTPLYASADIAIHTSKSESLSNFLIEAQAHGLPVVAYAAQGVDECFLPGDTGEVIQFGDQASFRTMIIKLAAPDPARSERARIFAHTTFDQSQQVQSYLNLFAQLATPGS